MCSFLDLTFLMLFTFMACVDEYLAGEFVIQRMRVDNVD